jgi:hypothetical protein
MPTAARPRRGSSSAEVTGRKRFRLRTKAFTVLKLVVLSRKFP